jgi:hypothetical protein
MQVNEQAAVGRAFDSARRGLTGAQARLDRAADSVAALTASDQQAAGNSTRAAGDISRDMVELSRAGIEAQANAASYRVASDVMDELVNVGQRIDVRV